MIRPRAASNRNERDRSMARLEGSLEITGYVEAAEYRGLRFETALVGDGRTREFRVRHSFGRRPVSLTLYDGGGRAALAAYRCPDDSELIVSFYYPPAAGEAFTAVVRR